MSPFRVVVTTTAHAHVRAVVRGSVEIDRGIPETFLAELDSALARIGEQPYSGHPYRRSSIEGVYRVLLRRSGCHAYFTVDAEAGDVVVRAVCCPGRGAGPALR